MKGKVQYQYPNGKKKTIKTDFVDEIVGQLRANNCKVLKIEYLEDKNGEPLPGREKRKVYTVSLEPRLANLVKKLHEHNLSGGINNILDDWAKEYLMRLDNEDMLKTNARKK